MKKYVSFMRNGEWCGIVDKGGFYAPVMAVINDFKPVQNNMFMVSLIVLKGKWGIPIPKILKAFIKRGDYVHGSSKTKLKNASFYKHSTEPDEKGAYFLHYATSGDAPVIVYDANILFKEVCKVFKDRMAEVLSDDNISTEDALKEWFDKSGDAHFHISLISRLYGLIGYIEELDGLSVAIKVKEDMEGIKQ